MAILRTLFDLAISAKSDEECEKFESLFYREAESQGFSFKESITLWGDWIFE